MNISEIGNASLTVAILVAITTLLVSLATVRFASETMRRTARRGIYLLAGILTVACAALMYATVNNDFSLSYVVRYTEKALPLGYRIAAFWAGQEGSLLLWAWLLACMASIWVFLARKDRSETQAMATGAMAVMIGLFCALMLFTVDEHGNDRANPFATLNVAPPDGQGMNPMLQDPLMLSHPPILFIGYAGFTIPFVLLIGALLSGRADNAWVTAARPWVLVSWLFLGAGILLGAAWAYVELGWGGYWAWDPVENASLLPWLTGTALLHSIVIQRKRGMFKRWTATLTAATLILCVFATYVTRSGIVNSVHSFGPSPVGTFFLIFLGILVIGTGIMLIARWRMLAPEQEMESLFSREGAFLAGNVMLVAMTLVTMIGTMFPVISRVIAEQPVAVSQGFYNTIVLPMGLALMAVMALAPVLGYGRAEFAKLARSLGLPIIMAIHGIVGLWVMGYRSPWALVTGAVVNAVIACVLLDFIKTVWARHRQQKENLLVAGLRMLDMHKSRYGGYMVHVGMVLIVAGVAASSLYNTEENIQFTPGHTAKVGNYTLKLEEVRPSRGPNFESLEAVVMVTDAQGKLHELHPQYRLYTRTDQRNSEVALRSNWREDLYVTLAGWDDHSGVTTLQVIINPLVKWMWLGGLLMALGSVYCLMPRLSGGRVEETEETADAAAARPGTARVTARQVA